MDNICNTFGSLGAGISFIIHNGRLYTYSAGYRSCDSDHPADPGSKSSLIIDGYIQKSQKETGLKI